MKRILLIFLCLGMIELTAFSAFSEDLSEIERQKQELRKGLVFGKANGMSPKELRLIEVALLLIDAREYHRQKDWEKAEDAFKKVIAHSPEICEPYYTLGIYNIGTDEGQQYFEQAIDCEQHFAASYYWHGYVDYKNGYPKKARPYLVKFLEVAKIDPEEGEGRVKVAEELIEAIDQKRPFPYPETQPE